MQSPRLGMLCATCRNIPVRVAAQAFVAAATCPVCDRASQPLGIRGLCPECEAHVARHDACANVGDYLAEMGDPFAEVEVQDETPRHSVYLIPRREESTGAPRETEIQKYLKTLWGLGIQRRSQMATLGRLLTHVQTSPEDVYTPVQLTDIIANVGMLLVRFSEDVMTKDDLRADRT